MATSVTADNTATPLLPNSTEIFTFDGAATTIATYASATAGPLSALVFDGAGWHDSADLVMPENIMPTILPPYSPELNPVENAWEYLRKNKLANRLYETYEDIVAACCDAWNSLIAAPDRIASIPARTWAKVS